MTLTSATEDFASRTLDGLGSDFRRLAYLATLQGPGGYDHWGLERKHGREAAADAIARAHTAVFLRILEMTVAHAAADLHQAAGEEQRGDAEFLNGLAQLGSALVPRHTGGGSAKHLQWILFLLAKLVDNGLPQTGRAA